MSMYSVRYKQISRAKDHPSLPIVDQVFNQNKKRTMYYRPAQIEYEVSGWTELNSVYSGDQQCYSQWTDTK
jgi:hypothetical protein